MRMDLYDDSTVGLSCVGVDDWLQIAIWVYVIFMER
jgi:hypothetical protein